MREQLLHLPRGQFREASVVHNADAPQTYRARQHRQRYVAQLAGIDFGFFIAGILAGKNQREQYAGNDSAANARIFEKAGHAP